MPPFTAIAIPREPHSGVQRSMAQRNMRLPLQHVKRDAPDAIRYSDYWDQGKPLNHAWSHAQVYTALNIAESQAVQEDFFMFGKMLHTNLAQRPSGMHAPLVTRANIFRPEAQAYGSQYTVNPVQPQQVVNTHGIQGALY